MREINEVKMMKLLQSYGLSQLHSTEIMNNMDKLVALYEDKT